MEAGLRWVLFTAVVVGGLVGVAAACEQRGAYTLYRNSIAPGERIHVATFDAEYGEAYNRANCEIARGLFANQPGVQVQYWCEPGRFRKLRPS
jgi:hypothetical protein